MRKFVDNEVIPNVYDWDTERAVPPEFYELAGKNGIIAASCDASWSPWAKDVRVPGGIAPEEWDAFHTVRVPNSHSPLDRNTNGTVQLIVIDELSRSGSGGLVWAIIGSIAIGLPPIIKFGSDELKQHIVPECLAGRKRICLAITEPSGGSDVANIVTSAKKTDDGQHYIVNGEKKWIVRWACCANTL